MSEDQLKAFLEAVKTDAELQEKLKAATDADDVVAISKAAGFVVSAEELKRAQAEVSEEELAGAAGGGAYDFQQFDMEGFMASRGINTNWGAQDRFRTVGPGDG